MLDGLYYYKWFYTMPSTAHSIAWMTLFSPWILPGNPLLSRQQYGNQNPSPAGPKWPMSLPTLGQVLQGKHALLDQDPPTSNPEDTYNKQTNNIYIHSPCNYHTTSLLVWKYQSNLCYYKAMHISCLSPSVVCKAILDQFPKFFLATESFHPWKMLPWKTRGWGREKV